MLQYEYVQSIFKFSIFTYNIIYFFSFFYICWICILDLCIECVLYMLPEKTLCYY